MVISACLEYTICRDIETTNIMNISCKFYRTPFVTSVLNLDFWLLFVLTSADDAVLNLDFWLLFVLTSDDAEL
jgi:hypothetical protein